MHTRRSIPGCGGNGALLSGGNRFSAQTICMCRFVHLQTNGRNADMCLLSRASNHSICAGITDSLSLIKRALMETRHEHTERPSHHAVINWLLIARRARESTKEDQFATIETAASRNGGRSSRS